ncbi:hypothetical protein R80B4_02692 [Fibrobacteres bacterium R8-0-B4]
MHCNGRTQFAPTTSTPVQSVCRGDLWSPVAVYKIKSSINTSSYKNKYNLTIMQGKEKKFGNIEMKILFSI